jgi:hypothetical protein
MVDTLDEAISEDGLQVLAVRDADGKLHGVASVRALPRSGYMRVDKYAATTTEGESLLLRTAAARAIDHPEGELHLSVHRPAASQEQHLIDVGLTKQGDTWVGSKDATYKTAGRDLPDAGRPHKDLTDTGLDEMIALEQRTIARYDRDIPTVKDNYTVRAVMRRKREESQARLAALLAEKTARAAVAVDRPFGHLTINSLRSAKYANAKKIRDLDAEVARVTHGVADPATPDYLRQAYERTLAFHRTARVKLEEKTAGIDRELALRKQGVVATREAAATPRPGVVSASGKPIPPRPADERLGRLHDAYRSSIGRKWDLTTREQGAQAIR